MAFGEFSDPTTIALIVTVVIVVVIASVVIVIYGMRKRAKTPKKPEKKEAELELGLPYRISKSVQSGDASHAKDELRILELERDILSDAIRRLYEAHAEGKISEDERERLASTYKARMTSVKNAISKDETIVALHELEGMQEDLMKLFSERFGELSSKVEELRTRIDVKPLKEVKVQVPTPPPTQMEPSEAETEEEEETEEEGEEGKEKAKKKRKPPSEKPSAKTEAEQRIDEIRTEVEKVLDKLGQMEIET